MQQWDVEESNQRKSGGIWVEKMETGNEWEVYAKVVLSKTKPRVGRIYDGGKFSEMGTYEFLCF